jgi:hypothetical protein
MKTSVGRGLAIALVAILSLSAAIAAAEQRGGDGVVVHLDASVSPLHLPRHRRVPVNFTLEGKITSSDGSPPPKLAEIEMAFGAHGGLSTAGLPRCPRAELRASDPAHAMRVCGRALVGTGTMTSKVYFPEQGVVKVNAALLAFNGRTQLGGAAIWVLIYPFEPAWPVSLVLPFYVTRLDSGAFDLILRSPVARALGRWPQVRSFRVTFGRRYGSLGERRSFLSAGCPLPPRFHVGLLPMARATYRFAPAPTLTTTVLRACRVRD